MDGQRFTAKALLREKVNRIVASTRTRTGTFTQEQVLLWDRGSFPRTGFYLDDHVMVFEDLASERPTHAFDHFYLGFLKSLHEKYGFKVTLNCFFENPDATFNLTMMPGCWRSEFRREALSVHCRGNAVDQDRRALDAYALDFHLEPLWGLDAVAMIQNRALPVACDIQHFLPLKPLIRLHLPILVEIIVFHPVERLPVSACEIRNLHRHSAELD